MSEVIGYIFLLCVVLFITVIAIIRKNPNLFQPENHFEDIYEYDQNTGGYNKVSNREAVKRYRNHKNY